MNIILNIQGGLGKCILSTALTRGIKKKYPNSYLIVVSGYPDVYLNNPTVNKSIRHNEQNGIYEKYIKNNDSKFFIIDPYLTNQFQNDESHLINIWFELCGLKYKKEKPEFYLSKVEKQFYNTAYKSNKPILTIQTNGGASNQTMYYNWARDMPENIVSKLINDFKKDYEIVHVKRKDQITYSDTKHALDGYRSIAYLLSISERVTNPEMFGYNSNINIKANTHTKKIDNNHSNYKEFQLVEPIERCPYNDLSEIFDYKLLYNAIKSNN